MADERKHCTFYLAVQKVSWSDAGNDRERMKVVQTQNMHFCAVLGMQKTPSGFSYVNHKIRKYVTVC